MTHNKRIKYMSTKQGGDPFGWYSIGNPDMCSFSDGTYCFTPIQITMDFFTINLQEHGCCVPGTAQMHICIQCNLHKYQGHALEMTQ